MEPAARVQVEVVGGFVQQQDVGAAQQQRGEPQQHRLAAGQLAGGPVQADVTEAEFAEGGQGALLDVPVVADGLEVLLGGVARLDGVQGGPPFGDAEGLVDAEAGVERDVLREQADLPGRADGAGGRDEFPGQQLEQGGLARSVGADEAGPAGSEGDVQAVEDGGAVGPGEGEVGTGEGSC